MVVVFPNFGRQLDEHQKLVETCSATLSSGIAILDYSSKIFL
jgi:hypothetical protein